MMAYLPTIDTNLCMLISKCNVQLVSVCQWSVKPRLTGADGDLMDVESVFVLRCGATFLPRCMECRRGLAMRILSVRPSVRPSVCHTREL